MAVMHWCLVLMLVVTPAFTMVSVLVGGLNLTVVPGCCAVLKVDPPNRELLVPKGLAVVLVEPKRPPVLVLVPKLPNEVGLLAPKALLVWENRPPVVPVLVLPNRDVEVPVLAPKPKPEVVEEVAG